jgi:hypothetical protein
LSWGLPCYWRARLLSPFPAHLVGQHAVHEFQCTMHAFPCPVQHMQTRKLSSRPTSVRKAAYTASSCKLQARGRCRPSGGRVGRLGGSGCFQPQPQFCHDPSAYAAEVDKL